MMGDRHLQPKKVPISDDYRVTGSVLGLGINGKVVECYSKSSGQKCALKVVLFCIYCIMFIYVLMATHAMCVVVYGSVYFEMWDVGYKKLK